MMKKFFLIMLGILISFDCMAEQTRTVIASSETTGEKCGNNCHWTVYSDGTLDITGSGPMYDATAVYNVESYNPDKAWLYVTTMPWGNYLHSFSKVNIADNITYIGNRAFFGLNVSEINFGENSLLRKVDETAFYGTPSLSQVIIPETVTYRGSLRAGTIYCTATQVANSVCGSTALIYEKKGDLYFISDQEGNLQQVYEGYNNFADNTKLPAEERSSYQVDENGNVTLLDNTGNITGKYTSNGTVLAKYTKNPDGSTSVYDANGKLTGLKNAKLITPAQAAALVKKGNHNTVTLTFK